MAEYVFTLTRTRSMNIRINADSLLEAVMLARIQGDDQLDSNFPRTDHRIELVQAPTAEELFDSQGTQEWSIIDPEVTHQEGD